MITLTDSQNSVGLSWASQWTGARLKYGVKLINNKAENVFNYIGLENVESWTGRLAKNSERIDSDDKEDAATGNRFYPGNVLFGKLRPYLAKAFVAEDHGCCTSELLVFCPLKYDSNYLKYLILTPDFINLINSSTYGAKMPRASWDFIGNIVLPTPPLQIQKSIAHFLDRKTAAIDTLIAKKQRLIQLLEEKRTALINQAVTKGLNPNAPMKDSGIPWIGEIPEHWNVVKLSLKSRILNGTTPDRLRLNYWQDGTVPWVSSGEVNEYFITNPTDFITEKALRECSLSLMPKGAIVIGMIGQGKTRGTSARLGIDACINQNIACIIPESDLNNVYLHQALIQAYEPIRELARGGNQGALNCELVGCINVPLPPFKEQQEIAQFLEGKYQCLERIERLINRQIEKLQEYRRSLITAAVTGKLDITQETIS